MATDPEDLNRPAPARSAAGFTLLELMIVCGVIAVLMGLAIGYLGRTDPQAVADSVLGGELRAAQWTARAAGLPTEVVVRPGVEGYPATVRSRLLEPFVSFHFEPDDPALDDDLKPAIGGEEVLSGRFGRARRNVEGRTAPVLRWAAPPELIDLEEGFALRCDVFLEERGGATVLQFGGVVDIRLDPDSKPWARLRLTGGTAAASAVATVRSPVALPLRRWVTIDFGCDGRECWLSVDGREFDRAVAEGQPLQADTDELVVSPGDAPVAGILDEVRVFTYSFGPTQYLPTELQPDRPYRIAFDASGEPVGSTAVKLLTLEEEQQ
ncbi:MAG: prepilin-type N-terminal cleavage/methylation domain-containing protein [bacterium]|nr:prepilin-type N-terminal cleavage/methylation domain-containing protein [bacterium]